MTCDYFSYSMDDAEAAMQCGWYGFPQRPRKKKCKHFEVITDDPSEPFDYEDGMEDWDEP